MILNCDGLRIQADLDMPEKKADKMPLVVLIHGFTGNRQERHILAAAKTMNECGFAVLRPDMYGHGESDGKFGEHTLYKWLTQALFITDYARSLPFVSEVYLCGHSQGGLTVILTAAMKQDQIAGLMPLSPAVMIPEQARAGTLLGTNFDPCHVPDSLHTWDGLVLNGNYIRVAQTIRVEDAVDAYKGPVLIIHGAADDAVPISFATRTAQRYANCHMDVIPEDDHCFNRHLDLMTDALKAWLLKVHPAGDC